jgi:hypothetical protein
LHALSSEPYLRDISGVPMLCRDDSGVPRPRGDSSEPRLNFSADYGGRERESVLGRRDSREGRTIWREG